MAKKDLRAQMDAARAAAAFIGAAQEADQARGAQEAPAPASSAAVSGEASPSVAYEVVSLAEEAPISSGASAPWQMSPQRRERDAEGRRRAPRSPRPPEPASRARRPPSPWKSPRTRRRA